MIKQFVLFSIFFSLKIIVSSQVTKGIYQGGFRYSNDSLTGNYFFSNNGKFIFFSDTYTSADYKVGKGTWNNISDSITQLYFKPIHSFGVRPVTINYHASAIFSNDSIRLKGRLTYKNYKKNVFIMHLVTPDKEYAYTNKEYVYIIEDTFDFKIKPIDLQKIVISSYLFGKLEIPAMKNANLHEIEVKITEDSASTYTITVGSQQLLLTPAKRKISTVFYNNNFYLTKITNEENFEEFINTKTNLNERRKAILLQLSREYLENK